MGSLVFFNDFDKENAILKLNRNVYYDLLNTEVTCNYWIELNCFQISGLFKPQWQSFESNCSCQSNNFGV